MTEFAAAFRLCVLSIAVQAVHHSRRQQRVWWCMIKGGGGSGRGKEKEVAVAEAVGKVAVVLAAAFMPVCRYVYGGIGSGGCGFCRNAAWRWWCAVAVAAAAAAESVRCGESV